MSELEKFIKSNFGLADSTAVNYITSLFKFSKVKKGVNLLKSGDHCEQMIFIQSGYLRMYNIAADKEVTQWVSTKGTIALEVASFYSGAPSKWNIQSLVESELFLLSKKDYDEIANHIQDWNKIERLFLVGCFSAMENRIYSHLSMSSQERYDLFFEQHTELFNQVPLRFIASMLGMTPETLSRIRAKIS